VKNFLKSVNIWQSYKQERDCFVHFARLANTPLNTTKVHETITHVLGCNGALKSQEWTMQEWTILEDMSGVDFAGVDNDGGNRRRWTTMERISPTLVELT